MKKVTGDRAEAHYAYIDPVTGEYFDRLPEYTTMSRRPGIGRAFYDKYSGDIFPSDMCIVNGVPSRPPRFYENCFEITDPDGFERLKRRRVRNARKHSDNNTPDRLKVREELCSLKLKRLKRSAV